jgi:hypothetical protein
MTMDYAIEQLVENGQVTQASVENAH